PAEFRERVTEFAREEGRVDAGRDHVDPGGVETRPLELAREAPREHDDRGSALLTQSLEGAADDFQDPRPDIARLQGVTKTAVYREDEGQTPEQRGRQPDGDDREVLA